MFNIIPSNFQNYSLNPINYLKYVNPRIVILTTIVTTVAQQTLINNPDTKKGKLKQAVIYVIAASWIGTAALTFGVSMATVATSVSVATAPILLINKMLREDFFDEDISDNSKSVSSSSLSKSEKSSVSIVQKRKSTKLKLRTTVLNDVGKTDKSKAVKVANQDFSSFLKKTFTEKNSGLWIGTPTNDSTAIQILIDHMKNLKNQGVEHFYLPFLPHRNDRLEWDLVKSCSNKKIEANIKSTFEKIHFGNISLLELFKEAKKYDISFSLTHGSEKYKTPDSYWIGHTRKHCGKYVVLDVLKDSNGILDQQKNGLTPLAHDLKIPSLLVEESDSVKKITFDSGKAAQSLNVSGKLLIPKKSSEQK